MAFNTKLTRHEMQGLAGACLLPDLTGTVNNILVGSELL